MICQLGVLDCREKWIKVLTPMGVCFELEIQRAFEREFDSFSDLRSSFANNVLGLVAATNLTDATYGWHGGRTGLVLYFYTREEGASERREISLTSTMVLSNFLIRRKSTLLGGPYTGEIYFFLNKL